MTHSSSNDSQTNNPLNPGTPDVPAADRPLPPLPAPDRVTNVPKLPALPPLPESGRSAETKELPPLPKSDDASIELETVDAQEKPALPPLPVAATTEGQSVLPPPLPKPDDASTELLTGPESPDAEEKPALPALPVVATPKEQPMLPPIPKPGDASTELSAALSSEEPEDPKNVIQADFAPPSLAAMPRVDDSEATKPVEEQEAEIKTGALASNLQGSIEEEQPAGKQAVSAFTDEQQFILSLSPHENLTVIEGCGFLPALIAMADGEVDQMEKVAQAEAHEKFMGLFESADALANEQFETKFLEQHKEMGNLDKFFSKFKAAQDEAATKKLVTYFMADFSRVLEQAPESVAQKIKDHIRESCLEVAEASGEGAGANICGAEAIVIGELLGLLEIELDEETQNRIFGSLEQQSEMETIKIELQADPDANELAGLKEKLSEESETFQFLHGLPEQQADDFFLTLTAVPALVAAADGTVDGEEFMEGLAALDQFDHLVGGIIEMEIQSAEYDPELVMVTLGESLSLTGLSEEELEKRTAELMGSLLEEGTALERNQKLTKLLEDFKSVLVQAPDSLQASLKEWLLESSVKVSEASGSDKEGDDKIGIEERQLLVTLFKELDLDYKGTSLEARLNIDREDQDFRGYLSTLNAEDRIRILALPHVLVEIVAASDGKIDSQEAMAITPILKEQAKALDSEFPVIWRENLDDVQKFGKGLTAEFQDLHGTKKQLEWVFGLLDGYWKILATMPLDLQKRFRTSILKIVTEVAEVSGDGGVAGNIGVEEKLLIDVICESLGIEREADVTALEVD